MDKQLQQDLQDLEDSVSGLLAAGSVSIKKIKGSKNKSQDGAV